MIQASILRQLAISDVNVRVSTTILRPTALAIGARYANTISSYFSTKSSAELRKAKGPDFTNDLSFAENTWAEREAQIRKKALQSSLSKIKRESLVKNRAFDVNETALDLSTVSRTVETGNFLTKAEFDPSVESDSSDHTFDENDFPVKAAHVVTGTSEVVGQSKKELSERDHTFDVNNNPQK